MSSASRETNVIRFAHRPAFWQATCGILSLVSLTNCTPPAVVMRTHPITDPGSVEAAARRRAARTPNAPAHLPPARFRGVERRPDVSSVESCPPTILTAIGQMLGSVVTLHGAPTCSDDYDGEWVAIITTGTDREATDVWLLLNANGRLERHRVRRTPAGVKFTATTIHRGIVAMMGRTLATGEMPANAEVLVTFAVPFPGSGPPSALDLSPEQCGLLGATDRGDLDQRLANVVVDSDPESESVTPLLARILTGARGLIGVLPSTQSVPVVRAWQLGAYERLSDLHAQLDPTNNRVSIGEAIGRRIADRSDCHEGWRCVSPSEGGRPLAEMAVATQALFKRSGPTSVLAGLIEQPPRVELPPTEERLSAQRVDDATDRRIATSVALEGPIEGRVVGASRGPARIVAFITRSGDRRTSNIYVVVPDRAPRRFEDDSLGGLTVGPRTIDIRDVDGDAQPEFVTVGRIGATNSVGIATLFWPPSATDRVSFARLDAMRTVLEAEDLAGADRALRSFAPSAFEEDEQACQALAQIGRSTTRQLAGLVPSAGLTVIDYNTAGQPLRGRVHRMNAAEMRGAADPSVIFGPFSSNTCPDIKCDAMLGFCKYERNGREVGYLWLGARRGQPFWGVSRYSGR